MIKNNHTFLKLAFFFFAVLIAVTQLTTADLNDQEPVLGNLFTATTLDFANQNTANNTPQSLLFNVTGLLPGGFQVRSVRIAKVGELGFDFRLTAENMAGDAVLCQALDLMVFKNWQIQYDGNLSQVNYVDKVKQDQSYQDLVLVLKLNNASSSLISKTCGFDLKIQTVDDPAGSAFFDEETLTNQVTTATSW